MLEGVRDAVGVSVGVELGVTVAVGVAVAVGVLVAVAVAVEVGVLEGVNVAVGSSAMRVSSANCVAAVCVACISTDSGLSVLASKIAKRPAKISIARAMSATRISLRKLRGIG